MKTINVYDYQNPRQILLDALAEKQKNKPEFSVRRWAKEMGLSTHSLLVMILQGKRPIRVQHTSFLGKGLGFNTNEQMYFQTLVQYENAKNIEEKNLISNFLSDLHPNGDFTCRELDEFEVIANWIHMTILAITQLKNFNGTEKEVYSLLGGKVTLNEIRAAMTRLINLDLLAWTDDGLLKPTCNYVTTKDDISNRGAREYHRQVMGLAKDALEEVPLTNREFQSFTMAVAEDKVPLAKKMIRQFRNKLHKTVSGEGDNVYQTNIQFFQLTGCPGKHQEDKGAERTKH